MYRMWNFEQRRGAFFGMKYVAIKEKVLVKTRHFCRGKALKWPFGENDCMTSKRKIQ